MMLKCGYMDSFIPEVLRKQSWKGYLIRPSSLKREVRKTSEMACHTRTSGLKRVSEEDKLHGLPH
jgi:hypothetical protein